MRLLSKSQQVLLPEKTSGEHTCEGVSLPASGLGVSNSATVNLPFNNVLCPLVLQVRKLLRAACWQELSVPARALLSPMILDAQVQAVFLQGLLTGGR